MRSDMRIEILESRLIDDGRPWTLARVRGHNTWDLGISFKHKHLAEATKRAIEDNLELDKLA